LGAGLRLLVLDVSCMSCEFIACFAGLRVVQGNTT